MLGAQAAIAEATRSRIDGDSLSAVPRSFDFSVDSTAGVEQIHSAFSTEDYWVARLAAFGGFGRLDSLTTKVDGSVSVVVVQQLRNERLPGLVAKFFPTHWGVVQEETWCPVAEGLVRGKVTITPSGVPGSGFGTTLLAPAPNGSRLNCMATVEFNVPWVGGKIEAVMARLLVQQVSVIQRFTTKWVKEHA